MSLLKLKAGALQLTMFIVVVIALLLAAFIILVHTHKTFKLQTDLIKETIVNTERGIDYVLKNSVRPGDSVLLSLDDPSKTLQIYKDHWGIFDKVISQSTIKQHRFKKVALAGASQPKTNRTALYVKDNNRPLVVVGDTKIQGAVFLPKQGIRTGNIAGHSYYGNQLVYGASKTSKAELPKLSSLLLSRIKNIRNITNFVSEDQFIDLNTHRRIQNSFYNPVQIIYSPNTIFLSEVSLIGHILIQSKTKIVIDPSANLKDVVLIAPEIDIKSRTKGTFQALATKHINVGNHCKLGYPSVLVINEDSSSLSTNSNNRETPSITIKEGAHIKGIITYLGQTKNYKAQVFIDKHAEITGEIYCNQNLEVLGKIHGSVFTSNFVANQSGSSYQNHIYNAEISIDALSPNYIGLPFEGSKKNIAKWLY